jgi:anti-sigma factor RsiW
VRCDEVAEALPRLVDGSEKADREAVRHVETCLRCQADLASYRRLLRLLHQLRYQIPEPPEGLVGDILAVVEEAAERGAIRSIFSGRRLAYVGGFAAAAGAAGVAGAVVVMANRGRSRRVQIAS